MRITAVDTFILESRLEIPFSWSKGWIDRRSVGLVRVETDEGVVGWGEGAGGASAAVVGELSSLVMGQDAMNRAGLWNWMHHALYNAGLAGGFGGNAISALDIALWDIAGQRAGLPIYQMLGGAVRERVAVYATGLYYTEGEFPTRLLDEARGYVELGFKGMKTKVGGQSIAEDVRRVAALREAIGPDVHLMVDANQGYNAATAIRIGQQLEAYDVLWFEEPVNGKDLEAYLQVKAALPMAIAGGEVLRTRYEFKEFLARRGFDIAQPDVGMVGGISELRTVAMMANAFGVQVNPHVWGSPIMIAATLHVTATLPPCPPAREPLPYMQEPVMEFDRTPSTIRDEVCEWAFEQEGGYVRVPQGVGLGVTVDEKAVARMAVRRERYT